MLAKIGQTTIRSGMKQARSAQIPCMNLWWTLPATKNYSLRHSHVADL